ncbi:hypothetical protein [Modestobacter versicolor]|uniref:hypothetical protein n=1 Tax=Modestobacter versicolor TaxID=429133 RepID=UPI0034E01595
MAAALDRLPTAAAGAARHGREPRALTATGTEGGLGWPGDPADGTGLGWPGDRPASGQSVRSPAPRRTGWRRLFGGSSRAA